jgi:hypothetical protein
VIYIYIYIYISIDRSIVGNKNVSILDIKRSKMECIIIVVVIVILVTVIIFRLVQ